MTDLKMTKAERAATRRALAQQFAAEAAELTTAADLLDALEAVGRRQAAARRAQDKADEQAAALIRRAEELGVRDVQIGKLTVYSRPQRDLIRQGRTTHWAPGEGPTATGRRRPRPARITDDRVS